MKTLNLPVELMAAWRKAVLAVARLPRGTVRTLTDAQKVNAIIRKEAGAVVELWEIFTQDRGEMRRQLLSGKREAVSYLIGFHLSNAARMTMLLERTEERHALAKALAGESLLIHDFGAGSGAMAQALLHHLKGSGVDLANAEVHLTDASGALLDAARVALESGNLGAVIKTHRAAVEGIPADKFQHAGTSIYTLGYLWNEMVRNRPAKAKVLKVFASHLERKEKALVLLVEPATQNFSRDAQELRDSMVDAGWVPLYPCPHIAQCPMLDRTRDWCYSEAQWSRPKESQAVDKMLGIDRSTMGGSMYAFATPALAAKAPLNGAPRGIVVGRPTIGAKRGPSDPKPAFEYLVCTPDGTLEKALPKARSGVRLRGESY